MKKYWLVFFIAIMTLPIYAYIDPMSGSTILYLAAGIFAALFYGLRGFFYRLLNLWKGRGFVTEESIKDCDIIFYSEGRQYWNVFLPVIEELERRGVPCAYLTSDKNDPGLSHESNSTFTHYLGGMAQSWSYLNNLQATMVVMTTPQLDIMTLKRSKGVKHYSHILHSPTDIHSYRKFAFDYFDSVLCSGPYQIKSIKAMEEVRKSNPKKLYKTGLTYYDVMLRNKKKELANNSKPVVLVAPTWQPYCILNRFGLELIEKLLESKDYHVLLRPHPQSYVSYPDVVNDIEMNYSANKDFEIDKNASGDESLHRADIMISDISGVAFDFSFIHDKPVVFFDVPFSGKGMDASNLSHTAWDMDVRDQMGALIDENDIHRVGDIINKILNDSKGSKLNSLKESSIYNFGQAGPKAADQILEILETTKC